MQFIFRKKFTALLSLSVAHFSLMLVFFSEFLPVAERCTDSSDSGAPVFIDLGSNRLYLTLCSITCL